MGLSIQQQAVLDWADNETGSLNLIARAGCGKTYTLIALVKHVSETKKTLRTFLGAFNTAIAGELNVKLTEAKVTGDKAMASTMHGAGNRAWRKMNPRVKTDKDKISNLLRDLEAECRAKAVGERFAIMTQKADTCSIYATFVRKAVSFAKQRAFGFLTVVDDMSKWYELIEHFNLDEDLDENVDIEELVRLCIVIYKRSVAKDREVIDFDDMIIAPLIHGTKVEQFDFVLLDEAQDTNPARRALALKMLKPGTGRLVAVGDPAQAIYGFTGADGNSMDLIKDALGSKELPLNLTYRCPKAVVALAQTWVPDIQAHDTNPQGAVRTVSLSAKRKEQK